MSDSERKYTEKRESKVKTVYAEGVVNELTRGVRLRAAENNL